MVFAIGIFEVLREQNPEKSSFVFYYFTALAITATVLTRNRPPDQQLLYQRHISANNSAMERIISTFSSGKEYQVDPIDQQPMVQAINVIKNKGGFDCVSISGLVMLLLAKQKIPAKIERAKYTFQDDEDPKDFPHSYILVNHTKGALNKPEKWNKDTIILCPWYNVCEAVGKIPRDDTFYLEHPLLIPLFKKSAGSYTCQQILTDCSDYLAELEEALEQTKSEERSLGCVIS